MGQALAGEGENHRVESQESPGEEKEGFTRALSGPGDQLTGAVIVFSFWTEEIVKYPLC